MEINELLNEVLSAERRAAEIASEAKSNAREIVMKAESDAKQYIAKAKEDIKADLDRILAFLETATPAVVNINVNNGGVTGIEDVEAAGADKLVNVVTLDGVTVKAGVKKSEALDGLQKGIYIVDGEKYAVK